MRLRSSAYAVVAGGAREAVHERPQVQPACGVHEMETRRRRKGQIAMLRGGVVRREKPGEDRRQVHEGEQPKPWPAPPPAVVSGRRRAQIGVRRRQWHRRSGLPRSKARIRDVEQGVSEQVAGDQQRRGAHDGANHEMEIARGHGLEQQGTESGPAHDRLHDDRRAEQRRDGEAQQRDQGVRGGTQRVAKEQAPLGNARRPGRLDEGRAEDVDAGWRERACTSTGRLIRVSAVDRQEEVRDARLSPSPRGRARQSRPRPFHRSENSRCARPAAEGSSPEAGPGR